MTYSFIKYHGTGNDFVILDDRSGDFDHTDGDLIRSICTRRFGIGADGLILVRNAQGYDFEMVYFNSDGRISSMCGNGGRCAVHFAKSLGLVEETTTFLAVDGEHIAKMDGKLVKLKMRDVPGFDTHNNNLVFDTGSPHYVCFSQDVDGIKLLDEARKIRHHKDFENEGINVNFVEQLGAGHIVVRTYERGVEDETWSCGTGVVAASLASSLKHQDNINNFQVDTRGGTLQVSFEKSNGSFTNIWLTGPAKPVFAGTFDKSGFKPGNIL